VQKIDLDRAMKDAIVSLPMKVSLAYSNFKKELHV